MFDISFIKSTKSGTQKDKIKLLEKQIKTEIEGLRNELQSKADVDAIEVVEKLYKVNNFVHDFFCHTKCFLVHTWCVKFFQVSALFWFEGDIDGVVKQFLGLMFTKVDRNDLNVLLQEIDGIKGNIKVTNKSSRKENFWKRFPNFFQ